MYTITSKRGPEWWWNSFTIRKNRCTSWGNAKQYTIFILDSVFINSFMPFVYWILMLYSYRNNCSLGQKRTGVIPKCPLLFFYTQPHVSLTQILFLPWVDLMRIFISTPKGTPELHLKHHLRCSFVKNMNMNFTFQNHVVFL